MKNKVLRVLTYNIHKSFNISNQRFILHQIREALIHADADLLFLQEMQGKHDRHEKISPSGLINHKLSLLPKASGHISPMEKMQFTMPAIMVMRF
ncbi:MAG: hypothetical protein WCH01_13685 [Methylococcaceae bacterium]